MYKDLITYELSDNTSVEQLLGIAEQIVNDWMKKQPGFIDWEINANSNGSYTDIVSWETEEDAKNATKEMANIPNSADWYNCYKKETITGRNLKRIAKY